MRTLGMNGGGSPFGSAGLGSTPFEDIFDAIIGGSMGKKTATGTEAIIARVKAIGEERGEPLPNDHLDKIRHAIERYGDRAALFENESGFSISSFHQHGDDDAPESEGSELMRALQARLTEIQDRRRTIAELPIMDFVNAIDGLFPTAKHPEAVAAAQSPESPTAAISMASSLTAIALFRFVRLQRVAEAVVPARAFAELVDRLAETAPARFQNLNSHLDPYGIDLTRLADKLRKFAAKPRVDEATKLAGELSLLLPLIANVLMDVEATVQAAYANAANI